MSSLRPFGNQATKVVIEFSTTYKIRVINILKGLSNAVKLSQTASGGTRRGIRIKYPRWNT